MSDKSHNLEHPNVQIIPAKVFVILLALGMGMHIIAPITLDLGIAVRGLGALMIGLCFVWAYWCMALFRTYKTPFFPNQPTHKIIQTGPYAISRNPFYLAMIGGFFGFALMADTLWLWLLAPFMLVYLRYYVIPREESYLARSFAMEYLDYQRKVNRWV